MSLKKQILIEFGKNTKFCSVEEALYYIEELKDPNFSKLMIGRMDVLGYLNRLLCIEILDLAIKVDDIFFWEFALTRQDVNKFLDKMPVKEAIEFAKKVDHRLIWEIVFTRIDVRRFLHEDVTSDIF